MFINNAVILYLHYRNTTMAAATHRTHQKRKRHRGVVPLHLQGHHCTQTTHRGRRLSRWEPPRPIRNGTTGSIHYFSCHGRWSVRSYDHLPLQTTKHNWCSSWGILLTLKYFVEVTNGGIIAIFSIYAKSNGIFTVILLQRSPAEITYLENLRRWYSYTLIKDAKST